MLAVAAALIQRDDEVPLIHQQKLDGSDPNWSLPGGIVEPNEGIIEALRREVREETGLDVLSVDGHAYTVILEGAEDGGWAAFIFHVTASQGPLCPDDPDDYIQDCRFLSIQQAIETVRGGQPWRYMREPLTGYLASEVEPGSMWIYRGGEDQHELVGRFSPMSGFPQN